MLELNVIATPAVRASLLRYAQRRLAPADAEDVVQEALCDALGAAARPTESSELRRWLMTIVKRRVVDWFRSRRPTVLVAEDVATALAEPAVVARDLLRRIDAESSPTDRRTLGWLVREHDGESLNEIAAAERCAAPCMRQRIHRFRRMLRAQHLAAAFAFVLLAGAWASSRQGPIAADPDAAPIAQALGDVRGTYRIESLSIDEASPEARLLASGLRLGVVRIEGDRVIAQGAAGLTFSSRRASPDGALVLRSASGTEETVRLTKAADGALVVKGESGPFRGEIRLRRE